MKSSTKAWLVIGIVLVLVGVLGFSGVMSAQNWDFFAFDNTKSEIRTIDINESFANISVHSDTADVEFKLSDTGRCRVVTADNPKIEYIVSVENNTLTIKKTDKRNWFERFSLFSKGSAITVYLPQTGYAALTIDDDTGDIRIPKDFTFTGIDITADTGDISCQASVSGQIRLKTDTGHISLTDLAAGKLDLSVHTGKVDVSAVTCAEDLSVSVTTGKTTLTDITCRNLTSGGDTGDITMKNLTAAEQIQIKRSTGDVRFDSCDAAELVITTDTGDVSGTLLSDKVFITKSDTGRIDVPESVSGGKCKITTDTGDIKITVK